MEDNPDDEALTLRAFKKNNIFNEVTVARDGQEALRQLGLYWLVWNEPAVQKG